MRRSIPLLLVLSGVAACAPTGSTSPGAWLQAASEEPARCFQQDRIINFKAGETQQVYVRIFGGDVFAIRGGGCPDLGSTNAFSITPATSVGSRICVGDSVRIAVPNTRFGPDQCLARVERSLSPAEVEALPGIQRP